MGDPSKVKELVTYDRLVVQDLDELADKKEVIEAVSRLVNAQPDDLCIAKNFNVNRGM